MPEPEPMSWEEAGRWKKHYEAETIFERREWMRILLKAIALARQEKERADAAKARSDALAEAVGKLPITGGPVVDALRAYREFQG